MIHDNPMILNHPVSETPTHQDTDKEIIMTDDFKEELAERLVSKHSSIILPDELEIVDKKKKRE